MIVQYILSAIILLSFLGILFLVASEGKKAADPYFKAILLVNQLKGAGVEIEDESEFAMKLAKYHNGWLDDPEEKLEIQRKVNQLPDTDTTEEIEQLENIVEVSE